MKEKVFVVALAMLVSSGPALAQDEPGEIDVGFPQEELRVLTLDEVPTEVMATVRRVAPDVYFTSAESYWKDDMREFHLSGRLFREVWDVFVREDGKLIRTESDNQDS